MRPTSSFVPGAILAFVVGPCLAAYTILDDYQPSNFFSGFDFFTEPDPTHGFVKYIGEAAARDSGLISNAGRVYLGVDHKTVSSSGRASVRISSKKRYTRGLIVADIAHAPGGICGTWPAFWTVGPDWPNGGEIDIMEQVNSATKNRVTMHTSDGCTLAGTTELSSEVGTNCYAYANGNVGCGVDDNSDLSYGDGFNGAGGGVFATEWTSRSIAVWFWSRHSIPANVLSANPEPSQWGPPVARFRGDCNIDQHFREHQIVFDTTFCGDWAGNTWGSSSCAAKGPSCADFVANNPAAFQNAYWEINSLKVFQKTN